MKSKHMLQSKAIQKLKMNKLTNEQLSLLPTQEEIEQFRQRGWYVSKPIFSESEIEQALIGVQRHYEGERDNLLSKKISLTDNSSNFRYDSLIVQQNHQIASLTKNALMGYIASLLMASREIRLFFSAIAQKTPQKGDKNKFNVGWHTDQAYYKTCMSEKMLTAWIPLQDCDETMGTPIFLEGSHLKENSNGYIEKLKQQGKFFSNDSEFAEFEQLLSAANYSMKISTTRLRKGQCCFLDSNVLHYTGPNVSNNPRIAIVFSFQGKDNCYRKSYDNDGNLISSCYVDMFCNRLPNGNPDYTDPNFFPMLWPM